MVPGLELLPCQRDSYLREIHTTVVSCDERKGAKGQSKVWDVVLRETCLYPEGGGQPCDLGTIRASSTDNSQASAEVTDVIRDPDGQVRHAVTHPFTSGDDVIVTTNWSRRYDHMQQHTGQHVLSAVVEELFCEETTSWELHPRSLDVWADDTVAVDINTPGLSQEDIKLIETRCNQVVREAHSVRFIMSDNSVEMAGLGSKWRGALPATHGESAPLRLIVIGDLDVNPCGGTHLATTAELQVVKIVGTEKTKGMTRLRFFCGERVLSVLGRTLMNEARLTKLLSCGPVDHEKSVGKALGERSELLKTKKQLSEELADTLGHALAAEEGHVHHMHREGAEALFLSLLAASALASAPDELFLLTGGASGKVGKPGEGIFVLAGPPGVVSAVGPMVAKTLDGRGGGRAGRFQGKASHVERGSEALDLLRQKIAEGAGPENGAAC